jgi:hypothetical protein
MSKEAKLTKKEGEVFVYEIELAPEELGQPITVPLTEKETRLVVRLAPRRFLFSV